MKKNKIDEGIPGGRWIQIRLEITCIRFSEFQKFSEATEVSRPSFDLIHSLGKS